MRALSVLALCAILVAFVVAVVSVATPAWLDDGRGVFLSCNETISGLEGCTNVLGQDVLSFVTCILIMFGIVSGLCGAIFFIVFMRKDKKVFGITAAVLILIAVVAKITGGSVYTVGNINATKAFGGMANFGYSYYLIWISTGLELISTILAFVEGMKGE